MLFKILLTDGGYNLTEDIAYARYLIQQYRSAGIYAGMTFVKAESCLLEPRIFIPN